MIILCLGLPSSASTWAFNVTRGLLVGSKPHALGVFAQSAADLQRAVPPGTKDLVLKAHTLDDTLFRLVETSRAVLILTWRDPRDAAASMAERTGAELGVCIGDIQRSASVVLSLIALKKPDTIVLDYGQNYMNRIETIHDIARVLDINPSPRLMRQLFESLKTSALKKSIGEWSKSLDPDAVFSSHVDVDTHWHKNHLGDGRSGKWREVPDDWSTDVDAALGGYQAAFEGQIDLEVKLPWDRLSHPTRIGRTRTGAQAMWSNGVASEIHLPPGWWTLRFDLAADVGHNHVIECAVECRGNVIAQRLIDPAATQTPCTLMFEHANPGSPVQVRFGGLERDGEPAFRISKLNFKRLSELAAGSSPMTAARRVSTKVLPIG